MKISEIVVQLANILPLISSKYTDSVSVATISGDGATATVTTAAPHGLLVGSPVYITNVLIDTVILAVTLTGSKATIETATDHDLTLGWPPHTTVRLDGFTDTNWNNSFTLLEVNNRRKFVIDATSLVAPILLGSEVLKELVLGGFNGTQQVATVPDATTFTFASTFTGASSGGDVVTDIRIAGAVSGSRAQAEYTAQEGDDFWLFVTQLDNVSVSKDRRADGDAISEQGPNTSFQLDILDGFTVWAFVPVSSEKAGLQASDIARDEVLRDLLLSLQRYQPASGLASKTPARIVLSNHGPAVYNGAIYVHEFVFQIPLRMTMGDTLTFADTVAFRDVSMTINNPDTAGVLTALVNLDEEPII